MVLYMYSLVIRLSWQQSLLHGCIAWRNGDVAGKSALLIHPLKVNMIVIVAFILKEVVYGVQLYRKLSGCGIAKRRNNAVSFIPIGVLAPFSFAGAFASLSPVGAARVNLQLS